MTCASCIYFQRLRPDFGTCAAPIITTPGMLLTRITIPSTTRGCEWLTAAGDEIPVPVCRRHSTETVPFSRSEASNEPR